MPTYDYVCKACGHRFERFQRMSEGSLRKCPKCSELKLRRLLGSGAGIIFRGSGFYETDYKRKSTAGSTGGNGSASKSGSSSSSEKSNDSKKSGEKAAAAKKDSKD